jgi:hypothetical protein
MNFSGYLSRLLTACFLFAAVVIFSCKKEFSQTLSPQDEQQANLVATQSDAEAEAVFNGIFDDVIGVNKQVGFGGTGLFMRNVASNYNTSDFNERASNIDPAPPCLTVTAVTSGNPYMPFPITITFDFGAGCAGADGHVRKGKIIVNYTDRLLQPAATATLQFDNFSNDSIQVSNSTTYVIKNTGTLDKLQFTVDIDAKLTKPGGNYTEWHSHKIITRIEGSATASPLDDVMQIEGNASGTLKKNDLAVAWNAEITDPLIKKFTCRWISKGTVKESRENLASNSQWIGSLDYGNGNCDNLATLTLDGVTYQITLH